MKCDEIPKIAEALDCRVDFDQQKKVTHHNRHKAKMAQRNECWNCKHFSFHCSGEYCYKHKAKVFSK